MPIIRTPSLTIPGGVVLRYVDPAGAALLYIEGEGSECELGVVGNDQQAR